MLRGRLSIGILWTNLTLSTGISISFWRNPLSHMGMGKTVYDALVKKFTYIQEEHVFFAAAFKYDSQNSLRQHDFELILDFYENLIREKTGRIPDETIHCILEMYCHSSIYMTVKWVLGELECAPEGLAKILVDGMPGKLSELFEKLEILS